MLIILLFSYGGIKYKGNIILDKKANKYIKKKS